MISFQEKTYRTLLGEMLARVSDRYDKRDTSPIPTALGPAAYALEGYYLTLDRIQRAAFVQTAEGEDLDLLAVLGGLSRYPASAAIRLGVFDVPVPVGARFSTIDGAQSINFVVLEPVDDGRTCRLEAEVAGEVGNRYTGPLLPITPVSGLTSAQVTEILIPGDEEEGDQALRERLLSALTRRTFGGNVADYRANILALDGVGAVQIYPVWDGGGTVKCSIVGADFAPASGELVAAVQNAIDPAPNQGLGLGLAPIGAKVTVCAPTPVAVDVSAALTLAPGNQLAQVEPLVEAALEEYLLQVRRGWGEEVAQNPPSYQANVYLARVLAAIVGLPGVLNGGEVTLNGQNSDLLLPQTGQSQQIPILGEVTLRAL